MPSLERLFQHQSLEQVIFGEQFMLGRAVDALPDSGLDEVPVGFAEKCQAKPLKLLRDQTRRVVSGPTALGTKVVITIPFEGDAGLWNCYTGNTAPTDSPLARVEDGRWTNPRGAQSISFEEYFQDADSEAVRAWEEGLLDPIEAVLDEQRVALDRWNDTVAQSAARLIETRRQKLAQADQLGSDLEKDVNGV